jgi:hypothetical protein
MSSQVKPTNQHLNIRIISSRKQRCSEIYDFDSGIFIVVHTPRTVLTRQHCEVLSLLLCSSSRRLCAPGARAHVHTCTRDQGYGTSKCQTAHNLVCLVSSTRQPTTSQARQPRNHQRYCLHSINVQHPHHQTTDHRASHCWPTLKHKHFD